MEPRTRSTLVVVRRQGLKYVLVLALYYLVPVEHGVTGTQLVLRTVGTVLAGLLVTLLIIREIRGLLVDPEHGSLPRLLTMLVVGVVFFAFADYVTALSGTHQFADLRTKTDGLYFALATLTTVGYGDVHASGQIARDVVSVQLVFNVVVIATGASVLSKQIGNRARSRRQAAGPG